MVASYGNEGGGISLLIQHAITIVAANATATTAKPINIVTSYLSRSAKSTNKDLPSTIGTWNGRYSPLGWTSRIPYP